MPDQHDAFLAAHPNVFLLDPDAHPALERYVAERRLVDPEKLPIRVERAGEGNMNLTLRVSFSSGSLILKQGRPWVEKYPLIEAPWERTLVEARFYGLVRSNPEIASRMPTLLYHDPESHILVLEDLGPARDYTSIYGDGEIHPGDLSTLLEWLEALGGLDVGDERAGFENRAMRRLNHEHIFQLPMDEHNGLDLDAMAQGLGEAARALQRDEEYAARVRHLGERYLADGPALVHGDYFPGSWIRTAAGVRIIDPEFCFVGAREFDYGVMLAHLALGRATVASARFVLAAATRLRLDLALVLGFAGTEIMRRLIGVAQLPLPYGVGIKPRLLGLSRALVLGESAWAEDWIAAAAR